MSWSVKQAIKKVIERAGNTVHETRTRGDGHQHMYPYATYAPRSIDRDFTGVYEQLRLQMMMDTYRCREL